MSSRSGKRRRKLQKEIYDKAVKIKCCYCDIKDSCIRRERKESYEKEDIITSCIMTPNRPKSSKRGRK